MNLAEKKPDNRHEDKMMVSRVWFESEGQV